MSQKMKFQGKEYVVDQLGETALTKFLMLKFIKERIDEKTNQYALFQTAKTSYLDSLKKEILLCKSGFLIEDN
mgnify:CR=1 FL=1